MLNSKLLFAFKRFYLQFIENSCYCIYIVLYLLIINNKDMTFITLDLFDNTKISGFKTNFRDMPKSAKLYKYTYDLDYNEITIYVTFNKPGKKFFIIQK